MSGRAGRGGEAAEGEIAAPMRTLQQMDTLVRFQITFVREGDRQRRALGAIDAGAAASGIPIRSPCRDGLDEFGLTSCRWADA
jgi:hypothetical protein